MPPKVFGMISTAKSREYTFPALQSFFAYTPLKADDEFHLIDNDAGSLDPADLKQRFPFVRLTVNPEQRSFAANMNSVFKTAQSRAADAYLLNNDLIFAPNWLTPLLLDEPCVLSSVSNMQFSYVTGTLQLRMSMSLPDFAGREREFLAIVKRHQEKHGGYEIVPSFPFYCVKIPKSVYDQVGFLDEAYSKAGFEDADYTVRCWEKGLPLCFATGSFVLHFYGKSSWQADSGAEPIHPDPKIGKRGEMLFRKRWGDEMTAMFAVQTPEGTEKLQKRIRQSTIDCLTQIAKEGRKYRDQQDESDEL